MDVTIPCPCPPSADGTARHESDTVTLKDAIDFPTAVLLQKAITMKIVNEAEPANEAGLLKFRLREPDVMALMTQFFVRNTIESWTLVDEQGKRRPVTPQTVEDHLESNLEAALAVADAADVAYTAVTIPLVKRVLSRFVSTPTAPSTSQKNSGSGKRPKPSKPSSISTIPTVVTGPTLGSPDGASNSLPSSATAA